MLYDPKWEVQTKPDVFSLESLIAWLEKQPAAARYCFDDNGHCLLARYFTAHGFINVNMGTMSFDHGANFEYDEKLPRGWNDLAIQGARTFGAALSRARKALAA